MRRHLQSALAVALLAAIFFGADALCRATHLPIPSNVVGLAVLLLALFARAVRLSWIERGADALLRHLGLFFVPAAVAVVRHVEVLRASLSSIVAIVVVSTLLVLLVTGLVAERLCRARDARGARDGDDDAGGRAR